MTSLVAGRRRQKRYGAHHAPCGTWTWTCGKANAWRWPATTAPARTLIKLILGLIRPSAGRVALFGHDAHSPRAAARARRLSAGNGGCIRP